MAAMNCGSSVELISWVLPTIWESLAYGITSVINNKENGTLSTLPVWLRVMLMPLAMPLLSGGTEPMMELTLGEANSDIPMPNNIRLTSMALYEEF